MASSEQASRWLERTILSAALTAVCAWGWHVNNRAAKTELALTALTARVDGKIEVLTERIGYTNQTLARIEAALKERP